MAELGCGNRNEDGGETNVLWETESSKYEFVVVDFEEWDGPSIHDGRDRPLVGVGIGSATFEEVENHVRYDEYFTTFSL